MKKVGIVGCGQMGAGIAEIAAKAGLEVVAREVNDEVLVKAQGRIEKSLRRAVEKGKLDESGIESALGAIDFTTNLDAMSDCDIVIEAVPENEQLKLEIFGALDRIARDDAILASNTSSLPITRLAQRNPAARERHRHAFLQSGAGDGAHGIGQHHPHQR